MQVQSLGQEDPLEKEMQVTPVFLPGKSHGQRSPVGYSPWGCKKVGYDFVTKQQQQLLQLLCAQLLSRVQLSRALARGFLPLGKPIITTTTILANMISSIFWYF